MKEIEDNVIFCYAKCVGKVGDNGGEIHDKEETMAGRTEARTIL